MSNRRSEVFNYIKKSYNRGQGFPTFQDISDAVGISKSTAHYHVSMLKKRNVVREDPVTGANYVPSDYLKAKPVSE